MARRARSFGMRVIYNNRKTVDAAIESELDATLVSLDELLAQSDVVSLNCPYSAATHHLMNAETLAQMQPTAFLINTARGPIVDEAALVAALQSGAIAGAGLDVFENEPNVHPGLLECDNAVLVPHLGSATVDTRSAMAATAANNVSDVIAGVTPRNPVTP
jgi:glyoxylate reductase